MQGPEQSSNNKRIHHDGESRGLVNNNDEQQSQFYSVSIAEVVDSNNSTQSIFINLVNYNIKLDSFLISSLCKLVSYFIKDCHKICLRQSQKSLNSSQIEYKNILSFLLNYLVTILFLILVFLHIKYRELLVGFGCPLEYETIWL